MKLKTGIMLLCFVFIMWTVCGCSIGSANIETDVVKTLYEFKGTQIENTSAVNEIAGLANNTEYQIEKISLQPYRITVNFKVDSRADYRYIDENGLNRLSGVVFSLIENADEILYAFYDAYSDEDAFSSYYYTKINLCERINSDKITVDYIKKATESLKSFEEYYKTIMATYVATPDRAFLDKVYEFIGDDYEIVINSSIGMEIDLDSYDGNDFMAISQQLSHTIGKYQGAGIKANLVTYDIRNFKTDEYKQCVFMYYTHPDEGLIMILSEFIDNTDFERIKEFIINN